MRVNEAAKAERRASPRHGWSVDSAAQVSVICVTVMAGVFALSWGAVFLIPVTAAFIVGLTIGPSIDRLERAGLPAYLAGVVLLLAVGGGLYGLFLAFAIPLEKWSARVPEIVDKARELVFWIREPLERLNDLGKEVKEAATAGKGQLEVTVANQGVVTSFIASAPGLLVQFFIFTGVFYFFLVGRGRLRTSLLTIAPGRRARIRVARIIRDMESALSRYLLAITTVNIGFGIAVGLTMWALDVPSPALWGALTAVLNFIPYLGAALMILTLSGVAVVTFDTLAAIAVPPLAFLALNLLESQVVTPTVVGAQLTLNPLVVFLSLAFWLWLWGPVGAFLAVPILILGIVILFHCLPEDRRGFMTLNLRRHRPQRG